MLDTISQYTQFAFFQRAIVIGLLIAISSSFLGTFLVLKKYSMIGDGLAHVSFASVALALLLNESPLIVSIPIVTIASLFILVLNEKANLHGDAAIGLVSSFAVATGSIIISVGPGFNIDLANYLFGNILMTETIDVVLSFILALIVVMTIIFFYNPLFSITYDEEYAQVNHLKTKYANYLLSILTSIAVVLGIRVVGTMLISSMIIFPTVSALQISNGFKQTIIYASFISVFSVIFGIFGSIFFATPPGASIVVVNGLVFLVMYGIRLLKST
jgi:zinc transport system permease protein